MEAGAQGRAGPDRVFSFRDALRESRFLAGTAGLSALAPAVLLTVSAFIWAWPPPMADGDTVREIVAIASAYAREHWLWVGLCLFLGTAGSLAFLRALLAPDEGAGASAAAALRALPAYAAASIIAAILILAGAVLLLVPGFYLSARLAPLGAVAAFETPRGPLEMILRTFDLTRNLGWRICLYQLVVTGAAYGVGLSLPAETSPLFTALVDGASGLFWLVIQAGLYRHLSASAPPTSGT